MANSNSVTVYDEDGHQIAVTGTFPNLRFPTGIIFDAVNKHLYVANALVPNNAAAYDEEGSFIESFPLNGMNIEPIYLAVAAP